MVCAARRHLQDQVGQPIRGIEPAYRFGRFCHFNKALRASGKAGEFGRQTARSKDILD
jgi:hypothetical protein